MPQGGERVQDGGRLVNKGVVPAGVRPQPDPTGSPGVYCMTDLASLEARDWSFVPLQSGFGCRLLTPCERCHFCIRG